MICCILAWHFRELQCCFARLRRKRKNFWCRELLKFPVWLSFIWWWRAGYPMWRTLSGKTFIISVIFLRFCLTTECVTGMPMPVPDDGFRKLWGNWRTIRRSTLFIPKWCVGVKTRIRIMWFSGKKVIAGVSCIRSAVKMWWEDIFLPCSTSHSKRRKRFWWRIWKRKQKNSHF